MLAWRGCAGSTTAPASDAGCYLKSGSAAVRHSSSPMLLARHSSRVLHLFRLQTLVELSDGSAVAVTVAKYQTPAGVDINKVWRVVDSGCRIVPGAQNGCLVEQLWLWEGLQRHSCLTSARHALLIPALPAPVCVSNCRSASSPPSRSPPTS